MNTINVIIITYNQEDVIGRCLDSILCQKDYGLKEIVVCDDCSKDRTWEVLENYHTKWPEIIRINRNERNMGIYPNTVKSLSLRGSADFYYHTAGDDAICEGWFEAVQKFLEKKSIDLSKPTGIYCDWKDVNNKGEEHVFSQKLVDSGLPLLSLHLRGKVSTRSLLVNDEVIKRYWPLVSGKGLNLEESVYDIMDHCIIENAYYLPFVGSIYYSGVGISVDLNAYDSPYYKEDNIVKWEYFIDHFIKRKDDLYIAKYGIEVSKFSITPSIGHFIMAIVFFHKSKLHGLEYGLKDYWLAIHPMLGAIKRKILKMFR